jgi:hypothetical protein
MLAPLFYAGADGCRLSDNSFLCFRQKAFLKSDLLAGFTMNVALIEYKPFQNGSQSFCTNFWVIPITPPNR